MKTRIAAFLAVMTACMAGPLSGQIYTEPFAGAGQYSLITRNDATFAQGAHVHLAALVGRDLYLKGGTIDFARQLPRTEVGLFVGGSVYASGRMLGLFNHDYHVGNPVEKLNLQNPGAALTDLKLVPSISDVFSALTRRAEQFANALESGAAVAASYQIKNQELIITLVPGVLNVINFDATVTAFLANQNNQIKYSGLVDGDTRLIVNYTGSAGSELLFNVKTNGLSTPAYDQVVWNFLDVQKVTFGQSADTFRGSIFAPNSTVVWNANDVEGQVVADTYISNQSRQMHQYVFWDGPPNDPSFPVTPIPEPSTYGLFGALVLAAGVIWQRRRRSRR